MQWSRYQTGSALTAALLAAASIAASARDSLLMWFLVAAALLLLLLAFAPAIPALRALPVIGAVRLKVEVSSSMLSLTRSGEVSGAAVVLRVGVTNLGRAEVRRARVNVLVPASITIEASDAFGNPAPVGGRGSRLPNTDESIREGELSAVWAERVDLDEGATMLHYQVRMTSLGGNRVLGGHPVRVKIESRAIYKPIELDASFEVSE